MEPSFANIPSIVISAIRGGGGKTIVSLGLLRALTNRGINIAPFKKGPDYIDAAWLGFAAKTDCYNLDPFLMTEEIIRRSFLFHSTGKHLAIIEGNRGLFDGMDVEGSCSTAVLSRLIGAKIILVVDCTKSTRTVSALILGCQKFEKKTNISGVILNQIAGKRHKRIVTEAIKKYTGLPVLGAIPRLKRDPLPMRHLGLTPAFEFKEIEKALEELSKIAEDHLDIEEIIKLAGASLNLEVKYHGPETLFDGKRDEFSSLNIGIIKDKAFQFYYPENIESLRFLGAKTLFLDSLNDKRIPDVHAIYIGGGFPETQAEALSKNREFKKELIKKIEMGLPVYAECGGLMYLGRYLFWQGRQFEMVGAIPFDFQMEKKPVGHGYTILEFTKDSPFFKAGTNLKGHEFHYSRPIPVDEKAMNLLCCHVKRGYGFNGKIDGISTKGIFGTYSHCHSLGQRDWAKCFLKAANKFRKISLS